jgi:4-diphosphocytidyl-2-C-methyl-D-erythritol kinase
LKKLRMANNRRILLQAHAKVNLGLLVLNKRPDGYHDIETIFHEIAWHDVIELTFAPGISMECTLPALPADASNLCIRAAAHLRQWTNYEGGAHIRLVKNIPIGSGLGGGSSDAAAVLRGLNTLWETALPDDELLRLGAELGSDVPFFIQGGTALGSGRGEMLNHRAAGVAYWIVVVVPPLHISTAWAYANVTPNSASPERDLHLIFNRLPDLTLEDLDQLTNDFESAVFRQYPAIRNIKHQLQENGALSSLMSGSGSSVFGLFDSEATARAAVEQFPIEYRTFLTRPLYRREDAAAQGNL